MSIICKDIEQNPQTFWIGNMSIPELRNTTKFHNILHYNEESIATLLNHYFSSVFVTDNGMYYNLSDTNNGFGSIYFTELDII